MGTKNGKWDGKGDPPSLKAAIAWLKSQGFTAQQAASLVPTGPGSLRRVGTAARAAAKKAPKSGKVEHRGLGEGLLRGISQVPDELDRLIPGSMPSPGGGGRKAPKKGTGTTPAAAITDANGDGSLVDDIAAAASAEGNDDLAAMLAAGPGAAADDGDAPLWPYDLGGISAAGVQGLTVENKSRTFNSANPFDRSGRIGSRIGARYFARDALTPLSWSAESRADLQRVMHSLGIYGDKKVRLGGWTAADQDAFTAVLEFSNVGGTRWQDTLAGWKQAGIPPELQDRIKSNQPAKPTVQVTNPIDIRSAAQTVSQQLTGAVDRGFVEGSVAPYQGLETAAQRGVYGDQEAGGGGTVTQAPSMGAYMEDKLRREKPLEVDGYQFLGQFEQFLSMLGAQ